MYVQNVRNLRVIPQQMDRPAGSSEHRKMVKHNCTLTAAVRLCEHTLKPGALFLPMKSVPALVSFLVRNSPGANDRFGSS